jgi:hypothetical protein
VTKKLSIDGLEQEICSIKEQLDKEDNNQKNQERRLIAAPMQVLVVAEIIDFTLMFPDI